MENMSKKIGYVIVMIFWLVTLTILSVMTGCYVTSYTPDPIYEDHPHTTEVYWYTDYELGGTPYFGYWDSFYYYYGIPHFYPWWYYYQFIPPYHYYTHSHIHIHCDNGHYVYGHRGPTLNNNIAKDFTPTIKIKNNKDKSFVFPRDWKSSNSTRINKHNNINKTFDYGNFNKNNNKRNNNINFNKNNKINKGNNGSTRPNKTNTRRKPK
tara:strand:- start:2432 stop:3058 length:627 start_codon:yes stop_codon:yes gene_type:complete